MDEWTHKCVRAHAPANLNVPSNITLYGYFRIKTLSKVITWNVLMVEKWGRENERKLENVDNKGVQSGKGIKLIMAIKARIKCIKWEREPANDAVCRF